MKKILFIYLACLFLLSGCSIRDNHQDIDNESKIGQIQNLKESSKEMPDFMIFIKGVVDATVMKVDMEHLKAYDFMVETLDENSEIITTNWTGIRLKDVLELKKIEKFDYISISSIGSVKFSKEELNDEIYLIFYKNDELITDISYTGVMLYAPTFGEDYIVKSLFRIEVV